MKKTVLRLSLIALGALTAFTACIRENENVPVDLPMITLRVSIPESPFTKAGFEVPDAGSGLHLKWMSGDKLRVFNSSDPIYNGEYDIQPGFTDHYAEFTGPVVSGDHFNILAPGTYTSVEDALAGNAELTQVGNGTTGHLTFTALLENVAKADLEAGDVGFTPGWVDNHSGTALKRCGIVKFTLTLPAALTTPKKVTMTGLGPDVSLNIFGVDLSSEHVLTAYAPAGWEDIDLPVGTQFTVSVLDADGTCYAATKTIKAASTLKGGMQNSIPISSGFTEQLFAGGNGSEASPYLIANAKQLDNMHADGVLQHSTKVYFRLIDDIDMTTYLAGKAWVPLNMDSPYDLGVVFDGAGHTIDHFSITTKSDANLQTGFFGVLFGDVFNLTMSNASVTNTSGRPTGILCGYCGYDGKPAHVYNVHVNGTVTYSSNLSGANGSGGVGALAGRVHSCLIESCSAYDINVTSTKQYAGGLFGYDWSTGATIRNCWTSGSVTSNGQRTGAIAGALIKSSTSIINCYSTAEVHAPRAIGGIAGYCNLDSSAGTGYETNMPNNTISGCIAWQTQLRTSTYNGATSTNNWWSSGAIVSGTSTHNILRNCWRRSDLDFRDFSGQFTLYDQDDASSSVPLVVDNPDPDTFKNYYPYHGKAAGASETLSDVARRIGWSEVIWDLSGDTPVLTGAVESIPSSGASAVTPGSAGSGPKYPSAGNGWTVTTVSEGITYYHYDNKDFYSTSTAEDYEKRHQDVFIVDVDLNNPAYKVKLVYASPSAACSQVFAETNAYAAINAGYEKSSIAVKANAKYTWTKMDEELADNELDNVADSDFTDYPNGLGITIIPNNTITDTGVPNWKNHGTVYFDGERGVQIAYDGYDPAKAPGGAGNPPVKSLEEQRLFYQLNTGDRPALLSSAPMLIENYNQVGKQFKTWYPKESGEPSEAPNTHQTSRYPRTAVALNADNHLLLFVCDGRYADATGGSGMSAYWVTQFLNKYFNPQYALNLDGGGSSTMCVKNQGDASTNVVNYPVDNAGNSHAIHNHDGQRARDTFIVVVPAE